MDQIDPTSGNRHFFYDGAICAGREPCFVELSLRPRHQILDIPHSERPQPILAVLAPGPGRQTYGKMYGRKRSTHEYQAIPIGTQGESAEASSPCIESNY
jgi:hypothetical protein